jgi:hypothetical protein
MCRAIASRGFPAAYLDAVLPGKVYIWASGVVVATAAVRRAFQGTLSSSYAPGIIASFGSGASQVDVRAVDPGGSASYKAAVSADLQARKLAGAELARNPRIDVSAVARRQLQAGRVDARVLAILASLAATSPVSVLAFGDSGPGAGATSPLRSVELASASQVAGAGRPGSIQEIMADLDAQPAPYHPARAVVVRLANGRAAVRVEFTAPSPLGLLGASSHARS